MSQYYFILKDSQTVPLRGKDAKKDEPPYAVQTSGSMTISGDSYTWTFYPAVNSQKYGSIQFTGTSTPPAGTYYTNDLTTAITDKAEVGADAATPATPAAPGGGSPGGSGGSSSVAASDASDLQQFLADHVALYIDKVDRRYTKDTLDKGILSSGGFGPASGAALAGFVAKIKERIPSSAVKAFTGTDPDISIDALTEDSSPEDLKFAWVATHPAGESGFAAAEEIGFDTTITSGQFATAGTPLRKLYDMLALSPAPFMVVTTPIPADAQIITSVGTNKNIVIFPAAFPDGAILGIGIADKDSAPVYSTGEALNTDVYGPVAKAVLAGSSGVTMQLVVGGTTYNAVGAIGIGESVTFGNPAAGAAASPAAAITDPVADAKSLSGESRLQMNTSLGVTVGGTQPGFILENVYMKTGGGPAMNSPQVILKKRTGGGGDVFELSVSTAADAVILIPIIVKQSPINEAFDHWTETILSLKPATASGATPGIPHVALKQITWGYEEHYRRFGLPDVGNIRLIAYEPSDSGSYPKDVNVISVAEALADGRSAESKWDPIDYAIAMYIGNNNNLVGTQLYTSSQLNRVMNSFPDARFRNG